METDNFWGKYKGGNYPSVRYDPLLTYVLEDEYYGFRVHVVPGRGKRPRDHSFKRMTKKGVKPQEESIFYKVSTGIELAIPISSESEVLGKYNDAPQYYNFEGKLGLTILNKYSPLNTIGENASGIALVTYSNIYSEDLSNTDANKSILQSLQVAINYLLNDKFQSSLIFFNIGPSSGASLRQLHAQSYVVPHNSGLLSGNFQQAYNSAQKILKECLTCKMGKSKQFEDHLGQKINVETRTIMETSNFRVIVPNAPMRALAIRIIPKNHINRFGLLSKEDINTLASLLNLGDHLINIATPSKWPAFIDRTVIFRQSITISRDFHFFIDMLPSIPFGGSELVDSLSITSLDPDRTAQIMNDYLETDEGLEFLKHTN